MLVAVLFWARTAQAQSPQKDLSVLLQERDVLFEKYSFYESQKSTFWGSQSKQDLRKIIETLKGIIRKDSEIVRAIRISGVEKQNQLNNKNMGGVHRIYELEEELSAAQSRVGQSQKIIKTLEAKLEMQGNYRIRLHMWALCSIVVVGFLVFWVIRQYLQLVDFRKEA